MYFDAMKPHGTMGDPKYPKSLQKERAALAGQA